MRAVRRGAGRGRGRRGRQLLRPGRPLAARVQADRAGRAGARGGAAGACAVRGTDPAALLRRLDGEGGTGGFEPLLPLRTSGSLPPLFCLHPVGGLSWCYSGLLRSLDPEQPVYGLQTRGLNGTDGFAQSLPELLADFVERMRAVQPVGPYHLLGWSLGGGLAQALAAELERQGEKVGLLVLLDSYRSPPDAGRRPSSRSWPTCTRPIPASTAIRRNCRTTRRRSVPGWWTTWGAATARPVIWTPRSAGWCSTRRSTTSGCSRRPSRSRWSRRPCWSGPPRMCVSGPTRSPGSPTCWAGCGCTRWPRPTRACWRRNRRRGSAGCSAA
ncbi:alpha/beta fold hydrolase [Streptacidiphilus sp. 4-A2]|nr:alpha/beta fold hydrolase [Streptacidiphilus sp. 4-A2]